VAAFLAEDGGRGRSPHPWDTDAADVVELSSLSASEPCPDCAPFCSRSAADMADPSEETDERRANRGLKTAPSLANKRRSNDGLHAVSDDADIRRGGSGLCVAPPSSGTLHARGSPPLCFCARSGPERPVRQALSLHPTLQIFVRYFLFNPRV
jgi:hypothetical protein